jgi:hypothetical protein
VRRNLIAAFAIVHVLACCAAAIPNASPALKKSGWQDARVKDELGAWAAVFGVTGAELEVELFAIVSTWESVRTTLLKPVKPWLKLTGLSQGWIVFVAGTRQADRFEVKAFETSGATRVLYRRGDDDKQWEARLLESQAWRNVTFSAAWPGKKSRVWRERACGLLAARAFDDDAAIVRIECAFLRRKNGKPGEPVGRELRVNAVVVDRK